jgi:hypothetical protein
MSELKKRARDEERIRKGRKRREATCGHIAYPVASMAKQPSSWLAG